MKAIDFTKRRLPADTGPVGLLQTAYKETISGTGENGGDGTVPFVISVWM